MTVTGGPERSDADLLTDMTLAYVRSQDENQMLRHLAGALEAERDQAIASHDRTIDELDAVTAERDRVRDLACALEAELAEATRDLAFLTDGRWPDA